MSQLKFAVREIPLDKLILNKDNIRFMGGTMVDGVKVPDTYNLAIMKDAITQEGGIPGEITVEEMADGSFVVLAGNRRTRAAQEMIAQGVVTLELAEKLKKVRCKVYKDLNEHQRRDLVNDQRNQRYMRSEMTALIWKFQRAGYSYPEIAKHLYPQLTAYTAGGTRIIVEVNNITDEKAREARICLWLKGTVDNVTLACGKMGPRVRKALLLTDLAIDGISPVIGVDEKGANVYEVAEFAPSQGRCNELRKAMKADGANWTPDHGGTEFNAAIAKFIREDKGIDENGNVVAEGPKRASADAITDQIGRTKSKAGKSALQFALGKKDIGNADYDDEAYRLEQICNTLVKLRDGVKNETVKEFLQIVLAGDALQCELFLTKHS